ncbi:MAG TPA: hypothetical protein VLZ83_10260 [Edaphocola sp.]|nr:hypothetical protein [Edaphocola sp.]
MSDTKTSKVGKAKRWIGISLFLVAFGSLLFAANNKQQEQPIDEVIVTLKNQGREENFLRKEDVAHLISNQGIKIDNQKLSTIDLERIERIVSENPWVKHVDVFVDNNSKLNVEVTQRIPDARIFDTKGNSFYLDENSFEMPLSDRYAYAIPVFTNYKQPKNDSDAAALKQRIIYLGKLIKSDSFWNAQITQIELKTNNNFSFYTTLGNQEVRFGDTSNAGEKLNNLYSFYKAVSNKIGWDRYEVLDVRFKGQVVVAPSLDWTPPKDTIIVEKTLIVNNQTINKRDSLKINSETVHKNEVKKKEIVKPEGTTKKKE